MTKAVDVKGLSIKFGSFTAVNNITFSVERGEIFGFLGANGAGKTTTIRLLCGLLEPSSGHAEVAGLDYKDGGDAIKTKVGYMSQKFTLYTDMTVEENIRFAGALRKIPDAIVSKREKELFDFIGFNERKDTMVKDLPGGLKQELSLVASMLHDPELIFLDEPTAGVSPAARVRFWELIRALSKQGKTVFVTTHYMDEAEQCHRIALMRAGEIIALDTPANLKKQTFPDMLVEIEPREKTPADWIENIRKIPSVTGVQPYGRRFHAIVKDSAGFEKLKQELGSRAAARAIPPSLEDVFIRLVEGVNR